MTCNREKRTLNKRRQSREQGMALVVSLVLLVVVTLVGLAGMRGTILQERMAGGAYDRETAFQAAEAALILGARNFIDNQSAWIDKIDKNAALDCRNKSCAGNPSLETAINTLWSDVPEGAGSDDFTAIDAKNPPQYTVQLLGACEPGGVRGAGFTGTTDQNEAGPKGQQLSRPPGTCYRVTARAIDPTKTINAERAQVVLQATYRM
jgi:type IV pilus assembly protein PilX